MNVFTRGRHRRLRSVTTVLAAAALVLLAVPAFADNVVNDVAANGGNSITAGGSTSIGYKIVATSDTQAGCNASDSTPATVHLSVPAGVTASTTSLTFTTCGDFQDVTFGSSVAGDYVISVSSVSDSGTGTYNTTPGTWTLHVSAPAPPANTAPSVAVSGFTDGAFYEIGVDTLPTATCVVTDDHDSPAPFPATMSGTLTHGLGTLTATCDYSDTGGLAAAQATAIYTIRDTIVPTIGHSLSGGTINAHNWYKADVTVTFNCADTPGSGIQSCIAGTESNNVKTFGEGAAQSVTGTATDWGGNQATDTVSGINIDKTAPTVGLVGGPSDGASYYFGHVPVAPTCSASDALSLIDGTCSVAGYGTAVGSQTVTATATDNAGNQNTASATYTVLAWTLSGFYQPVDMNGVYNTVKGGSTVPLKFEIFAGPTELTDTADVASFQTTKITCDGNALTDAVEITTTGGTSLRYDTTAGQFIQNWKTPTGAGTCYKATMTTLDGSALTAYFKIK